MQQSWQRPDNTSRSIYRGSTVKQMCDNAKLVCYFHNTKIYFSHFVAYPTLTLANLFLMYFPVKSLSKSARKFAWVYTLSNVLCTDLPENLVKTGLNFGYCENMISSVRLRCFDKRNTNVRMQQLADMVNNYRYCSKCRYCLK